VINNAELKVYNGAPHGLRTRRKVQVNADLLAFCKGEAMRRAEAAELPLSPLYATGALDKAGMRAVHEVNGPRSTQSILAAKEMLAFLLAARERHSA
jgi:hypothetical protein